VPQRWNNDRIELRVLFDRSLIEVFANDQESVITDPVYPTQLL
jgi:sucrose-6-phosphate hydrolase SacC (GH32 family)